MLSMMLGDRNTIVNKSDFFKKKPIVKVKEVVENY